jgi:predicted kinase
MGLPASGKTYFSERLAKELDIFFLNCDSLRLAMIEKPTFAPDEHAMVYRTVTHIAKEHLCQGQSIVCNANYHVLNRRVAMQQLASKMGVNYRILWVQTPYEMVRQRIQERDHEIPVEKMVHPPLELLERMQQAFEAPTDDEPTIVIDGTLSYEKQHQQFLNRY